MNSNLHEKLIQACQEVNAVDVQHYLDAGADPNFNLKKPTNALNTAIQKDNHEIVTLLLEYGAIVKEFVLQKAIEKDKNYLHLLIPSFKTCNDERLLMGALQAAINIGDVNLAKQAILQGATPEILPLHAIENLNSTKILQLLLENGFDIHADANKVFSQWMGSPATDFKLRSEKVDLLAFICSYYLEKPNSIEKFKACILDKKRLFRMGLDSNNFIMMKFAILIGTNKSESLNAAFYQYYAYKKGKRNEKIDYDIIEYILNSNIVFEKIIISNAVCFKYSELLNALNHMDDLEYGYEMAYKYKDDNLCEYFSDRGVSYEAQNFAKMKISALKGDIKELRKAVSNGADIEALDIEFIVEVINENQVESLKYLYDSGLVITIALSRYLNEAMSQHKAYETISYLIELGLDISAIKSMPREYKKSYPLIADMREKRLSNIFDYTVFLAREVYPNTKGKEKEAVIQRIAELSALPYVIKRSGGKST